MSEFEDASFNEYVRAELAKRDAEIERLAGELAALRKQKGISGARDGLTFNNRTGLWAAVDGLLYCSTCLDQNKRNPMKTEPFGWRCSVDQRHYFSNPDNQPQVINARPRRRI